jgi:phosphotriesterase-related protein
LANTGPTGKVNTVLGPVDASELGATMSHVHLTLDISCWYMPPRDEAARQDAEADFSLGKLGAIRRNGLSFQKNLRQDDVPLTIREVGEFKRAGGGAIVDMDLEGIGRNVDAMVAISRATGVHVIASTGWYIQGAHPSWVAGKSVEELADIMTREILEGIGDTGVRAGNIGEIGLSGMPDVPFHPDEEKVLRAAGRAQKATGASLTLHPNAHLTIYGETPVDHFPTYIDILEKEGADLAKVYPSHLGLFPVDTARKLLKRGVGFVSYDHFGHEEYCEILGPGRGFTPDRMEVELVMQLLADGYADRVLLGAEVGWKTCYKANGGWGYSHVLENIVPWLRACGATDDQIRTMTIDNPRRLHAM